MTSTIQYPIQVRLSEPLVLKGSQEKQLKSNARRQTLFATNDLANSANRCSGTQISMVLK